MKTLLLVCTFFTTLALSQQRMAYVQFTYHKPKDVILLSGNCLPENFVIVKQGSIELNEACTSLDAIPKQQRKTIQKQATKHLSNHVFVDFFHVINHPDGNIEPTIKNQTLYYYILCHFIILGNNP